MRNMNKSTEVILQKVERVVRLVLEPYYVNSRILITTDYSVSQK